MWGLTAFLKMCSGAKVEFNPYGYGPEDFIIPKVSRAKSLLQHTEQLQHEQKVRACWDFFRKNAEQTGYGVKCKAVRIPVKSP